MAEIIVTGADASDADARVLDLQLTRDPGAVTWTRVDAAMEPART